MVNNHTTKSGRSAAAGKLMTGSQKHLADPTQKIAVGGTTMTVGDAQGRLQTIVTNRAAVVTAQAAAEEKVAAEDAQLPELAKFFDDYVAFVRVTFGAHADTLVDFGLTAPKTRAPLTAEQKAVAAAKRKATRAARGTTSKKAKKSVHGNVDAKVVVTPATPSGTTPTQK
jgi:hypothetical protein